MASIVARIILHEKLKIADVGGVLNFMRITIASYSIKIFHTNQIHLWVFYDVSEI